MRLGQRTIQKTSSAPILLTGFKALNKLIGRDVYSSNLQLGGPKIMHTNGVSHQVVGNDYDGQCGFSCPKVFFCAMHLSIMTHCAVCSLLLSIMLACLLALACLLLLACLLVYMGRCDGDPAVAVLCAKCGGKRSANHVNR